MGQTSHWLSDSVCIKKGGSYLKESFNLSLVVPFPSDASLRSYHLQGIQALDE